MLYVSIFLEIIIKINIYRVLGIKENLIEKLLIEAGKNIESFYHANKIRKLEYK